MIRSSLLLYGRKATSGKAGLSRLVMLIDSFSGHTGTDDIPGKIIVNMPIPQRQVVTLSTALVKFPPIQVLIYTVSQIQPDRGLAYNKRSGRDVREQKTRPRGSRISDQNLHQEHDPRISNLQQSAHPYPDSIKEGIPGKAQRRRKRSGRRLRPSRQRFLSGQHVSIQSPTREHTQSIEENREEDQLGTTEHIRDFRSRGLSSLSNLNRTNPNTGGHTCAAAAITERRTCTVDNRLWVE